MKITCLGHGGAFAPMKIGNTSFLFENDGKKMLFDCGTTVPYILRDEMGINFSEIDAVYISHCHSDHIGGLPLFLQSRFWIPKLNESGEKIKPTLFLAKGVFQEIVDFLENEVRFYDQKHGLKVGLTEFCDIHIIYREFEFSGIKFSLANEGSPHIYYGGGNWKPCYGLQFSVNNKRVLFSGDTSLFRWAEQYDIIFQDCETGRRTGVHAHIDDIMDELIYLENPANVIFCHYTNPTDIKDYVWFKKGDSMEV